MARGGGPCWPPSYDGDPELKGGDPADSGDNRQGTSWELGDNGTVYAFEAQYHTGGSPERELPGVYKAGGFYMTGEFRDIGEAELATVSGNAMVWLLAERMLLRERPGEPQGLSWFGTLVFSLDEEVNSMTEYFSAGLVYQGLFRGRPGDRRHRQCAADRRQAGDPVLVPVTKRRAMLHFPGREERGAIL